jgi:hypothetical protein
MAIWYILGPFGNLVVIWYIFPRFGILYREKSGNPGAHCACRLFKRSRCVANHEMEFRVYNFFASMLRRAI